ncbi:MAG TPA: PQQ-dependent dehydrogenase, methanol/ethanol family [Candidatus Limnocylindrales bacterium]|nr:PQQ-dependent dehydrogenase, methanol/ethanol family [Candidatus Limnocylindrales bacterium]
MKRLFLAPAGASGAVLAVLVGLALAHVSVAYAASETDFIPGAVADVIAASAARAATVARVNDARLRAADSEPGQWMTHGRTWAEERYSPLTSINSSTVARLGLAWAYEPGTHRGMEATPLVIDGVMYATGEWSRVYAVDARTGKPLWTYDPYVPGAKGRDACCDVVNRGVAAWEGKLYLGALDGRLICLDAATGKPLWEKQTTDTSRPYTITGAPRIVKGKVIIGNGGAEFGVRGYFSAYNAATGEMLWRFYTVPASTQGPFDTPELAAAAPTWSKDSAWDSGLGGTVWDSMAYDPELDLLYVGVGNASVYNREQRSPGGGDNLYLSSILAVRPDDGHLVWHYQTTPGDQWDYTATQHIILADIPFAKRAPDGKPELRHVLMQAPKNGFFYVLDRATGELLAADPYIDETWATGVDLKTGRPIERPEATWSKTEARVTPGISGGHNWHPMAYSPKSGLVYIPTFESVYSYKPDAEFHWAPGYINTSESWRGVAAELEGFEPFVSQNVSTHLTAWDPVRREQAWRVELGQGIPAGVLATAGDLVFQGTTWGKLRAYDAASGALVWEADTGTGIIAPPISYEVGGEQYIAVVAGLGGSAGGHFIKFPNSNPGRILAFKLDAHEALPPMPDTPIKPGMGDKPVEAPVIDASAEMLTRGRALYAYNCSRCHGLGVQASGLYPDLRHASKDVYASWNAIVLGGAFSSRGMASFADVLSPDDAEAIRAYVADRAHHQPGWIEWFAGLAGGRLRIPARWLAN